jgi:hypothetical protein
MVAAKLEVVGSTGRKNPVYNSVRRFALEGLGDLIRVLMENVDDALFELSDKVDNDTERNLYFKAMREIRLQREDLRQKFIDELKQSFDRALEGGSAIARDDDGDELTLIELDELEDKIAIGNMVTRARPRFEEELFALSERLKLVLKRKTFTENQNPLDPKTVCECFHNASVLLQTDIQVKLIFYKLFERYVIDNLGHFYNEVNELFVEKGVLPGFKADQERMKKTTRFMANRIKKDGAGANPASTPGDNLLASLQQAISSGVYAGAGDGGNVPAAGGAPVPPTAGSGEAISPRGFVSALTALQNADFADLSAATDPQNLRAVTQRQLLAFREQNRNRISDADSQIIDVVSMLFDFFFDDRALPAPIKVLIGRLQIPILKVAIIDRDFFNQKKHPARKLLDSISRASLGWNDRHDNDQVLVGKIEEVVNFLLDEFADDIAVFEQAVARLEDFLQQENTTAAKAVVALQQQERQKDRQIQEARDAADRLIAKLTATPDLSFEVIDFLETTWSSVLFNAYLSLGEKSNHWRNLKRISTTFVWTLVPKHSEEERLRIIKTIPALLRALSKGMELVNINTEVQNRIFKVLAGEHARIVKLTSKNIVTRIDDETVWPEDGGAEAFARSQGIDPAETPDIELTTDRDGEIEIVEKVEDEDSIAVIDAIETGDVIEELNRFTVDVNTGQIAIDEEIVMESPPGEDFDLIDGDEDHLALAQAIEIGAWVEFIDASSKTLAARLSWKSKVTGNLVFANRQGQKVRNCSINGFAMELRAGRARVVESSSVFDRAIYSITSRMQPSAGKK